MPNRNGKLKMTLFPSHRCSQYSNCRFSSVLKSTSSAWLFHKYILYFSHQVRPKDDANQLQFVDNFQINIVGKIKFWLKVPILVVFQNTNLRSSLQLSQKPLKMMTFLIQAILQIRVVKLGAWLRASVKQKTESELNTVANHQGHLVSLCINHSSNKISLFRANLILVVLLELKCQNISLAFYLSKQNIYIKHVSAYYIEVGICCDLNACAINQQILSNVHSGRLDMPLVDDFLRCLYF